MSESSPLVEAQQRFIDALPFRASGPESCPVAEALGRTLYQDFVAAEDSPPYHRAIVEGFLVHTADTEPASEQQPVTFTIAGEVKPGDNTCPAINSGEGLRVATGSIVAEGPYSIVRMWEAQVEGEGFSVTRAFPPRFFIEEQGCDIKRASVVLSEGTVLSAADIGTMASLGVATVQVARPPVVTIFACGDEVIPYTETITPGAIRDSNSIMLAAAVGESGAVARLAGIMHDDFDAFVQQLTAALQQADMIVISGGTAAGGRDFISDLVRALGELIVDGVPMRSGRPLIMGVAQGKPLVCVAGHPPEALRGFRLFGAAALNHLLGRNAELPLDQ